jgi:hypothetical protein
VNITADEAEKFEVYVCPRCSTEKKQEFLNKPINNETKTELLNLTEQLLVRKSFISKRKYLESLHSEGVRRVSSFTTHSCSSRSSIGHHSFPFYSVVASPILLAISHR